MKWLIPAKTFFLGEYVATLGKSAFILTTSPCFELSLVAKPGLNGIDPNSPAGKFWLECNHKNAGLVFSDPYQGIGGLGASSAQFLGAYFAHNYLKEKKVEVKELLDSYLHFAWNGKGVRPSGYDLLAQSMQEVVYIANHGTISHQFNWPFKEVAFLLIHTGNKLATHHHLQSLELTNNLDKLGDLVDLAKKAFEEQDAKLIIKAVNQYHQELMLMNLVAEQSLKIISTFKEDPNILAVKGCGAMGADVILLLVEPKKLRVIQPKLAQFGFNILATSANLCIGNGLIQNKFKKRLEI